MSASPRFAGAICTPRPATCAAPASAIGWPTRSAARRSQSSSLTGAVTRGGLLRTAEQKLRAGDIQQTRQLLERIELNYPEEKLEGLYRVLRAEADRRTGRYEEALRNYEILLKLTQWSGFHDRAMHGLADTYFRLGELPQALGVARLAGEVVSAVLRESRSSPTIGS